MKNILLIEDDADDCFFFSKVAEAMSDLIQLYCHQDADHLLEIIGTTQPSIIFMDFYMPKRSGLNLLRQIKLHPDFHCIPVIMWSTSLLLDNVLEAYREGAEAFIQKPSTYQQLFNEISGILDQYGIKFQPVLDT